MQIFEFHFNPKLKEDLIFDTFTYDPENAYEKKLGSFYALGEIRNAMPGSKNLLSELAKTSRKGYYGFASKNPQKALSESLKKANELLANEVKKENVSWMGNLNFGIICLKKFELSCTKTGDSKMLLFRAGQITDIGKNLENQEIDPYPLKIFFNVISGTLAEYDSLLFISKEAYDFLKEAGILEKLSKLQHIGQKEIKELIPADLFRKGDGAKVCGALLLICLGDSTGSEKGFRMTFLKKENLISFLPKPIVRFIENFLSKSKKTKKSHDKSKKISFVLDLFKSLFKKLGVSIIEFIKSSALRIKEIFKIIISSIKSKNFNLAQILKNIKSIKPRVKNKIKKEEKKEVKNKISAVETFQKRVSSIENLRNKLITVGVLILLMTVGFLFFRNRPKEIVPTSITSSSKEDIVKTEELMPYASLSEQELGFEPQKMLVIGNNFYFYNPLSAKAYRLNIENKETEILNLPGNPKFAVEISGNPGFFSLPNTFSVFSNGQWQSQELAIPYSKLGFDFFSSYENNLYVLSAKNCQTIKYPYLENNSWGSARAWFKQSPSQDVCQNAKSIFANGSLWILSENYAKKYYAGALKENIKLKYPLGANDLKIEISEPNKIFVLKAEEKSILVMDRKGNMEKIVRDDKFKNIKDFFSADNGKTLWILSGWEIYKIEI